MNFVFCKHFPATISRSDKDGAVGLTGQWWGYQSWRYSMRADKTVVRGMRPTRKMIYSSYPGNFPGMLFRPARRSDRLD